MGLQHDNPNALENDSLRTQRMTADEARAVIALWQQERVEQTGLTDRPAVPDVAEGLDIPVEEVQRLLAAVRARRLEEERALAQEQELAQAETRLAEEEWRLTEVRRQRAQLRGEPAHRRRRTVPRQRWVQVKPGVWEDTAIASPVEWTGDEDFWKETEEDKEGRKAYRANRTKRTTVYMLYTVFLLFPLILLLLVFLGVLVRLVS